MKEYLATHVAQVVLIGTGIMMTLALTIILLLVWYSRTRKRGLKIAFMVVTGIMLAFMIAAIFMNLYLNLE